MLISEVATNPNFLQLHAHGYDLISVWVHSSNRKFLSKITWIMKPLHYRGVNLCCFHMALAYLVFHIYTYITLTAPRILCKVYPFWIVCMMIRGILHCCIFLFTKFLQFLWDSTDRSESRINDIFLFDLMSQFSPLQLEVGPNIHTWHFLYKITCTCDLAGTQTKAFWILVTPWLLWPL